MDGIVIVGFAMAGLALLLVIFLTFWSRSWINRIAGGRARSLREIQKELKG